MKFNIKHLESVLSKIKYEILDYKDINNDLILDVEFTEEDPGSGVMTSCMTISATRSPKEEDHAHEFKMSVEVYPAHENLDPIASKTESFKIKSK